MARLFSIKLVLLTLISFNVQSQFSKSSNHDLVTEEKRSLKGYWGDFNNDGYPDIYVVNEGYSTNSLFKNKGDGTFEKCMTGDIATDVIDASKAYWVDYNNDHFLDLFVMGGTEVNILYENNHDGSFTKITDLPINTIGGSCSSWSDYDKDGDLDVAIGQPNSLFINDGSGNFIEPPSNGFSETTNASSDMTWVDINDDGNPDLYVTNFSTTHSLFFNNGDGTLTENFSYAMVTESYNAENQAWGDYDSDGDLDLFIGNYDGNVLFEQVMVDDYHRISANSSNLLITDYYEYVEGSNWGDYNNDGELDMFMATSTNSNLLFRGSSSSFELIDSDTLQHSDNASYSANWSDINRDGHLDIFSAVADYEINPAPTDRNYLYINNGDSNHNWLSVNLLGTDNNSFGLGAKINAFINGEIQTRSLLSNGFGSHDYKAHFGLTSNIGFDSLVVEWPTGKSQKIENLLANQFIQIKEDSTYLKPAEITGLALDYYNNAVELSWTNNSEYQNHLIYRSLPETNTYDIYDTISGGDQSYIDDNFEENIIYDYKVVSTSSTNFSDYSEEVSVLTKLYKPHIESVSKSSNSINVYWVDNSIYSSQFVLEYSLNPDFDEFDFTTSSDTNVSISNLAPNTTYYIRVKALSSDAESWYSDIEIVTTDVVTDVIEPSNLISFKIYPNPTQENITMNVESNMPYTISILNTLGKTIIKKKEIYTTTTSFNLSHIPDGTYIVVLSSSSDTEVKKFIKSSRIYK